MEVRFSMKTYCFKLYHSKKNKKLNRQINIACYIYNHSIALHKRYYRLFHKYLNKYKLQKHLAKLKKRSKYLFWNDIPAHAIQNITDRIDRGYKAFFENLKLKIKTAPPKFKSKKKYKSLSYNMVGKGVVKNNTVKIAGKHYKFFKSRDVEGYIKLLTVKRDRTGDFYVYLVCEGNQNETIARMGESIGFDFGLKTFLTASDGTIINSPQFFFKNRKAIAKANRSLSRKVKGSNNREKARLKLAKLHKKVVNQRLDFHWKLAQSLCVRYATICIEDLNLKEMQKLHGKKINDLGFSNFVKILEFKASQMGTQNVKVDRYFASSQTCTNCGYKNSETKNLWLRKWTCPQCGAIHDRDNNAAINILLEAHGIREKYLANK